jgi:Domain of unknown function (DUF6966)
MQDNARVREPDIDKRGLELALRELAQFLEDHPPSPNDVFAPQIRESLREIEHGDVHGIRRFLRLFGGMGSLNDLVFYDQEDEAENAHLAERFDVLKERAWSMASGTLRQLEAPGG